MLLPLLPLTLALIGCAQAHEDHEQQPIDPDADWATRHMAEEHHITAFDAGSFFTLHDYDSSNEWTPEDILKTYGKLWEQFPSQLCNDLRLMLPQVSRTNQPNTSRKKKKTKL